MKELTRTECTGIFAIRSRMVKTKSNYKSQYNDQKCRWCTTELETQNHIMTKCPQFKDLTKHINYKYNTCLLASILDGGAKGFLHKVSYIFVMAEIISNRSI